MRSSVLVWILGAAAHLAKTGLGLFGGGGGEVWWDSLKVNVQLETSAEVGTEVLGSS